MSEVALAFNEHGIPLGKVFEDKARGTVYKSGLRLDIEYAKKKQLCYSFVFRVIIYTFFFRLQVLSMVKLIQRMSPMLGTSIRKMK